MDFDALDEAEESLEDVPWTHGLGYVAVGGGSSFLEAEFPRVFYITWQSWQVTWWLAALELGTFAKPKTYKTSQSIDDMNEPLDLTDLTRP